MIHRIDSKISKVRAHLLAGNDITPLKALGLYGVFRLASDISRLRDEMIILSAIRTAPNGATYAEYQIPKLGMEVLHAGFTERGVGEVVASLPDGFSPYFRVYWPGINDHRTYNRDNQQDVCAV